MIVRADAPIRIADLGGWTDTWFAGHGAVCHLAVRPGVSVTVIPRPRDDGPALALNLRNFGERHVVPAGGRLTTGHRLLDAALAAAEAPEDLSYEVTIDSRVPPGASTGTSAALAVAVLAAFDRIANRDCDAPTLARRAHAVEVDRLGQQAGVQDQIAAAHGGITFIEITHYPSAIVTPVAATPQTRAALDARLVLVYLGRAHSSSDVHTEVIRSLDSVPANRRVLDRLRAAAREGRDALERGDLDAYGRALTANTEAQAALHPALVSDDAWRVGKMAAAHGAAGWKVNGAGGDGGSVTVLAGLDTDGHRSFADAVSTALPGAVLIPIALSGDGCRVSSALV